MRYFDGPTITRINPAGFPGLLIVISVMVGFFSLFPFSTAIRIALTLISAGVTMAVVRIFLAKKKTGKKNSGILGL
jgi:hypothetical protein